MVTRLKKGVVWKLDQGKLRITVLVNYKGITVKYRNGSGKQAHFNLGDIVNYSRPHYYHDQVTSFHWENL